MKSSDSRLRVKKTSCPVGAFATQDSNKPKRLRPKSLAFDPGMIELHDDNWIQPDIDSSMASETSHSELRIRKYRSVISLSSDNTSSVHQQKMSKSVNQSPTKTMTAPKMIDVSPQYFSSSSKHAKSKEQGGSRVKELLFRRMSRSSNTKNEESLYKDSVPNVTRRSKSSSSPSIKSNLRFLNKKTDENDDEYLLKPHVMASYSSTEESD